MEESTKEKLNMSNNPPVESQHTESKPPLSESLEEDPQDEKESFSTRQLFKFAWQIAKGMVATVFVYMLSYLTRELAFKMDVDFKGELYIAYIY